MRSKVTSALLGATFLGLALSMSSAQAGTILVFGQTGVANTFTASNPTATTTMLTGSNIPVMITAVDNAVPLPGSYPSAFLTLSATSVAGTFIGTGPGPFSQEFSGTFSVTNGATNYLSGSFTDALLTGSSGSLGLTVSGLLVTSFTSNVITDLLQTRGISLSFTNVTPPAHNAGTTPDTFAAFTSNVAGNFSAQPDPTPEPTSIALLGIGISGFLAFRRLFKRTYVA